MGKVVNIVLDLGDDRIAGRHSGGDRTDLTERKSNARRLVALGTGEIGGR